MATKTRRVTDRKVVAALRDISDRHDGLLKPEDVVDAARSARSPLHKHFTWDDSEAAEKHRLHEARLLINVVVEYLPDDKREVVVPVFVSLKSDRADGSGYRQMIHVLSNAEQTDALLRDAVKDIDMFTNRYHRLRELVPIFRSLNKAKAVLRKKLSRRG